MPLIPTFVMEDLTPTTPERVFRGDLIQQHPQSVNENYMYLPFYGQKREREVRIGHEQHGARPGAHYNGRLVSL